MTQSTTLPCHIDTRQNLNLSILSILLLLLVFPQVKHYVDTAGLLTRPTYVRLPNFSASDLLHIRPSPSSKDERTHSSGYCPGLAPDSLLIPISFPHRELYAIANFSNILILAKALTSFYAYIPSILLYIFQYLPHAIEPDYK